MRNLNMSNVVSRALNQFGGISPILFVGLTLVTIFLVAVGLLVYRYVAQKEIRPINLFAFLALAVYVNIILQLTLLGRSAGSRIGIDFSIHKMDFTGGSDFSKLIRFYSGLNILLFVPYGFILSLFTVISHNKGWLRMILVSIISLISSLIIECVQLMTGRGYFEMDDLFCNTLGGLIGCVLACLVMKVFDLLLKRDRGKGC